VFFIARAGVRVGAVCARGAWVLGYVLLEVWVEVLGRGDLDALGAGLAARLVVRVAAGDGTDAPEGHVAGVPER